MFFFNKQRLNIHMELPAYSHNPMLNVYRRLNDIAVLLASERA